MFASARVAVGTEKLPVVPRSALREEGETLRAFVVKDGRVEERVLQPGPTLGDRIAIRGGITAGDRLVATPTATVSDGTAVR
jgi:membrane fusion protein (multidrug efflux system)